MRDNLKFYIDGAWVDPVSTTTLPVIDPSNETTVASACVSARASAQSGVCSRKCRFDASGVGPGVVGPGVVGPGVVGPGVVGPRVVGPGVVVARCMLVSGTGMRTV